MNFGSALLQPSRTLCVYGGSAAGAQCLRLSERFFITAEFSVSFRYFFRYISVHFSVDFGIFRSFRYLSQPVAKARRSLMVSDVWSPSMRLDNANGHDGRRHGRVEMDELVDLLVDATGSDINKTRTFKTKTREHKTNTKTGLKNQTV